MVVWFEIPVNNMDRAKTFYEVGFGIKIEIQYYGGLLMGRFPFSEGLSGASGTLI